MGRLHTLQNFSDGVAALPVHDRPDGADLMDNEMLTAFITGNASLTPEAAPKVYELMNKDRLVTRFEFDPVMAEVTAFDCADPSSLPIGFTDLLSFLTARRAASGRAHGTEILAVSGCLTVGEYLDVCHALGLSDTFWVREKGSGLSWAGVSLYVNPFNQDIARIALEGASSVRRLAGPSPEPSLGGSYAKCIVRRKGKLVMLKTNHVATEAGGWGPWSEAMAYQVASALGYDALAYKLGFYKSKRTGSHLPVTSCPLFTGEKIGFVAAST